MLLMAKCVCCGFPVSSKDTHSVGADGVTCGVCVKNLSLGLDIPSLVAKAKSYNAAGNTVSLSNCASSHAVAVEDCP